MTIMSKYEVEQTLLRIGEARTEHRRLNTEFADRINRALRYMVHQAAANRMSVEQVAKLSTVTKPLIRMFMRDAGLDTRASKTLLSKTAAAALEHNAELLGVDPKDIDLTSPLAYLKMGTGLIPETTNGVSSLPETDAEYEDRLKAAIVLEYEGWGEAWTTDESGDTLARVAAEVAVRNPRR